MIKRAIALMTAAVPYLAVIQVLLASEAALAWRVDGAVLTPEFWPLQGATVSIAVIPEGDVIEVRRTDDLGNFEFQTQFPEAVYRISVTHDGFLPHAIEATLSSNQTVYLRPERIPDQH